MIVPTLIGGDPNVRRALTTAMQLSEVFLSRSTVFSVDYARPGRRFKDFGKILVGFEARQHRLNPAVRAFPGGLTLCLTLGQARPPHCPSKSSP